MPPPGPAHILYALQSEKLHEKVVIPTFVSLLLEGFEITALSPPASPAELGGQTKLGANKQLGGSSLNLVPPGPDREFSIIYEGPVAEPSGFTVAISLHE